MVLRKKKKEKRKKNAYILHTKWLFLNFLERAHIMAS